MLHVISVKMKLFVMNVMMDIELKMINVFLVILIKIVLNVMLMIVLNVKLDINLMDKIVLKLNLIVEMVYMHFQNNVMMLISQVVVLIVRLKVDTIVF